MKRLNFFLIFPAFIFLSSLFFGCVPKGEANRHFENAMEFMELQMISEAMIEMNNGLRVMKKDPAFEKTPEKGLLTAVSLYFDGKNKEAISELEASVKKHKNYWNSYLLLSFIYLGDKEYEKSVSVLKNVPASVFNYGQLEFVKGLNYFNKKQYKKVADELLLARGKFNQKSLNFNEESGALQFIKNGSNIMVSYLLGQSYLEAGELKSSKESFLEVKKLNPAFSGINSDLAIVESKIKLKNNPRDFKTLNDLGWAYYEKGKYEEAIAAFRKAIAINPSFSLAHNNLGRVYYDRKSYQDAIYYFNKVFALNNNERAYLFASYNLGQLLRKQGKTEQALKVLEKALIKSPNDQFLKREYKIAMLRNAAKKEPNPAYFKDLGDSYFENGEYVNSAGAYRKYLGYKGNEARAYYGLGLAYSKSGLGKEALAQFRRAVELDPEFGSAYFEWGKVLRQNGEYKEAGRILELALKKTDKPQRAGVLNELAYAYFQDGDIRSAVRVFRILACQDGTDSDRIRDILRILA